MIQEFQDEVLDTSGQSDNNPRYRIRDNSGTILQDDVQISLKTPVTQEGTKLNKALFETFLTAKQLVATFDTPGTYNWTIPDVIKKKGVVDLFLMGGGGSGGAAAVVTTSTKTAIASATGGGAGYVTKVKDFYIGGQTTLKITVGGGGSRATIGSLLVYNDYYSLDIQGNPGNTTSVGPYIALGGEGGKSSSGRAGSTAKCNGANGGSGSTGIDYEASTTAIPSSGYDGSDGGVYGTKIELKGLGQGKANVMNDYNVGEIIGSAGGSACSRTVSTDTLYYQAGTSHSTSRGKGGDGATTTLTTGYAQSATGNGNGGGAITIAIYDPNFKKSTSLDINSGAGSPGLVMIFA